MTIVVGCDNAAVDLKNTLIACLKAVSYTHLTLPTTERV